VSMICGSDSILTKPTNDNGKIANDCFFPSPLLVVKINPLY
jgi:hypothetical protein